MEILEHGVPNPRPRRTLVPEKGDNESTHYEHWTLPPTPPIRERQSYNNIKKIKDNGIRTNVENIVEWLCNRVMENYWPINIYVSDTKYNNIIIYVRTHYDWDLEAEDHIFFNIVVNSQTTNEDIIRALAQLTSKIQDLSPERIPSPNTHRVYFSLAKNYNKLPDTPAELTREGNLNSEGIPTARRIIRLWLKFAKRSPKWYVSLTTTLPIRKDWTMITVKHERDGLQSKSHFIILKDTTMWSEVHTFLINIYNYEKSKTAWAPKPESSPFYLPKEERESPSESSSDEEDEEVDQEQGTLLRQRLAQPYSDPPTGINHFKVRNVMRNSKLTQTEPLATTSRN